MVIHDNGTSWTGRSSLVDEVTEKEQETGYWDEMLVVDTSSTHTFVPPTPPRSLLSLLPQKPRETQPARDIGPNEV